MPDPAYPPLDTLKPVAEGLWIVDSAPLHVGPLEFPVRMTVIRLADGSVWLHSPTRCTPSLRAEIGRLGPVRHLVAPSISHWMMVRDWQAAFPGAVSWAAPGLRDRRAVRRSGLRLDTDLGNRAPPAWEGEIDQAAVTGALGFHEIAFHHRASRTLVLTDLIINLEGERLPWFSRQWMGMAGALAPDGRAPAYLRWLVKAGGAAPRAAARRMLGWAPERVIFAHGRWYEADGTARLRRSLDWLL
ncbi:DUF4336 domain-containing protein [Roseomonas sp. OT10]|uniref:DUF4336 domain-containing protein n=1 Tax=Roseomonas cutis TaxID=2897332 RepID=UPI001E29855E|nr:DUF4336 domain-containing protein [Roseomonas sp. OT10]UFN49942.1 DUF4336 domain-containing protein [Roseomonas sp. OT10]